MSTPEQGLSLRQLVDEVERAARGNLTLGTNLARITEQVSQDTSLPEEVCALAYVLRQILAGERTPNLEALPAAFAELIQAMLPRLLEAEHDKMGDVGEADQEAGLSLKELLDLVETAVNGDQSLGSQLFILMQQMEDDQDLDPYVRALAKVLLLVLAGDYSPDLSELSSGLAGPVSQMLQKLHDKTENSPAPEIER